MTQVVIDKLNNLEQMLSGQTKGLKEVGNAAVGMDKSSKDFGALMEKTSKELEVKSSEKVEQSAVKAEEVKATSVEASSDKVEVIKTLNDIKSNGSNTSEISETSVTSDGVLINDSNWTEFRDMLTQITEEANVETSLDLTLARDINEIISQLKEAVENATEIIEKSSVDETEATEEAEDIAAVLLAALEKTQTAENVQADSEDVQVEVKVPFEQVLTFVDKATNVQSKVENSSLNEDVTVSLDEEASILLNDMEVTQNEIIEFSNNVVDDVVLEKTVNKENTNADIDLQIDEDLLKELNIESIRADVDTTGGETLMQNQTPEEIGVKVMINSEVEVFDLKIEAPQEVQTTQNAQPKTVEASPSRILDQITKQLEGLQNNSKVNIVLNPESLGKVSVQLLTSKEGLTAQFTVMTQEARDVLMKGLEGLKETLVSHGVGVDNVSVKLADTQKSEYRQDWTEQDGSRGGNKEQRQSHKEEKEKGLFEKMMAQTTEEENGNV